MKILHVSFADGGGGGAAVAAYRLHRAERRLGIDSSMLVMRRVTDDPHVVAAGLRARGAHALAWRVEMRLLRGVSDAGAIDRSLNIVPSGLHRRINASDADVVHLHWINGGTLSIAEVARIRKPLVWTLHDMWPFAGAEHYTAEGDERWRTGYSADTLDGRIWQRKRRLWRDLDAVFVAPSRWMAECASASALFRDRSVRVVPNTIDSAAFAPRDMADARAALNLPFDRRLLLFGAFETTVPRKGFDLLVRTLEILSASVARDSVELVVFGKGAAAVGAPIPVRELGWVDDNLGSVYNAADVLLTPSRNDNLPNTVVEAASCGVPAVAFRVGGLPDLVEHRCTGYLAEPFDPADFAAGIRWTLEQPPAALRSRVAARAAAFDAERIVPAYVEAYEAAIRR